MASIRAREGEVGKPDATADRTRGELIPGLDPAIVEETARQYERCRPGDSFCDLVHRSSFSKEDRRLLEDWLGTTLEARQRLSGDSEARKPLKQKPDIGEVARAWREAIQIAARCR